jgi:Ca2+-transporting ATPase
VRKRMTTFHDFDHQIVAFTKGSVESLLDVCTKIKVDGQIRPITSSDRDLILQEVNELANKAFRTLGICTKNISGDLFKDEEKDLT